MSAPQRKEYRTTEYIPNTRKKILKVVKKKKSPERLNKVARRKNILRAVGFSFLTLTMLLGAILLLYRYTVIMDLNNELAVGEKKIASLIADRDYLVTQIEPYKVTERVEKAARINLGMEYPSKNQIVYVNSDIKTDEQGLLLADKPIRNGMLSLLDKIANLR